MFSCPPAGKLNELLGEQLSAPQREQLEDHLGGCPRCRQALLDLSGDASEWDGWEPLLRSTGDPAAPADFLSSLQDACVAAVRGVHPRKPEPPPAIPGYEILAELGRGGMAVVYRARQVRLNRDVAIKMVLAGRRAGPELFDRFRREAMAMARLKHPNVVQIYDVGEHAGVPYLSMELVEGGSLKDYLGGTPHPPAAAAALVETLARAIHVAHLAGTVHRDLKPANILIAGRGVGGTRDGNGGSTAHGSTPPPPARHAALVPKISDFGLATDRDSDDDLTSTGDLLGTPQYMAPEQAQGRRSHVGPATDIHALGVILYEMLTGRRPFEAEDKPTTLVMVSFEDPVPPRRLRPSLPRDLETICLKCLHKSPHRRYADAHELAEDLRRFLAGEPIRARPVTSLEWLAGWARRRPAVAGLLASVLALLGAGFGAVTLAMLDAQAARREEAWQRQEAERARAAAVGTLDRLERTDYFGTIAQARSQWLLNNVAGADRLLRRCHEERRGWEWHFLDGLSRRDLLSIDDTGGPWVTDVAYSPNGRHIASAGGDPYARPEAGTLQAHDAATGRLLWRKTGLPNLLRALAYSPDGRLLATAGGNWRESGGGKLRLWDAATGEAVRDFPGHDDSRVLGLAFHPGGRRIATTASGRPVRVWDADTGKELYRASTAEGDRVAFTPDGRFLVYDTVGGIEFRAADDGKPVTTLPGAGGVFCLSPDGARLAAAAGDQLRVWDVGRVGTGAGGALLVQAFNGHEGRIADLTFRPDGRAVATAGDDGTVRVWELARRGQPVVLRGHVGRVGAVAFHPDGRALASGGMQPGGIKVWDATGSPECVRAVSFAREHRDVNAIGFSGDDSELLVLAAGGALRRWSWADGRTAERELRCSNDWLVPGTLAAFSDDGRFVAAVAAGDPSEVKVVETATGRECALLRSESGRVRFLACDRQCNQVAAVGTGTDGGRAVRQLTVWDVGTGAVLFRESAADEYPDGVALSHDGTQVLEAHRAPAATPGGNARHSPGAAALTLITLALPSERVRLTVPGAGVRALAFSPSGAHVAAAGSGGAVGIWTSDGKPLHASPLPGLEGIGALAFSPDSERLAGVNRERVQVWDVPSGQEVLFLCGAEPRPTDNGFNPRVAWSHDGRRLAASNWDRSVSIWAADYSGGGGKGEHAAQAASRAFEWHLGHAEAHTRPGDAFVSAFHLARLRSWPSLSPLEYRRRGNFLARRGEWDKALDDYRRGFADELAPNADACREYTALLVRAGDGTAYRNLRQQVLAAWVGQRDTGDAYPVVQLGCLIPASPEEAAQLIAAASRFQAMKPDAVSPLICLGIAHYRAGKWKEAREALLRSAEMLRDDEPVPVTWAFLAMTHLRLGQPTEANPWLKRVDQWLAEQEKHSPPATPMAPAWWNWCEYLEVRLLRGEAQTIGMTRIP